MPPKKKRIYVMDAGSSATRINEIALDDRGCFSQRTVLTYGPLTHLVDFLKEATDSVLVPFLTAFIEHIIALLPHKGAPLYVGLTGGIRDKSENEHYKKVLRALRITLFNINKPGLRFGSPIMDPLEECRLEQLAVRTLDASLDGHIGMGGASIQISRGNNCVSIPISTGTPLSADFKSWRITKKEFEQKLESYLDREGSALRDVVGNATDARYGGTETIAFVAQQANIERNTLFSVEEWVKRLKPFKNDPTFEKADLRNYVSCLIIYHLLSRFPSTAQLEHFELPQQDCPQSKVEATWSVGALADTDIMNPRKLLRRRARRAGHFKSKNIQKHSNSQTLVSST